MKIGSIHLFPVPLSDGGIDQLGQVVISNVQQVGFFLVERSKTARSFLKAIQHPQRQSDLEVREIQKEISSEDLEWVWDKINSGNDVGLLSEAGMPCIADPGSLLVLEAHSKNIRVIPYPGPNSMLMALMSSGLNGQDFCFHGYFPRNKESLREALIKLGKTSQHHLTAHIWMETTYRNHQMLEIAISVLPSELFLSLSIGLGTAHQKTMTKKIQQWKKTNIDFVKDIPAVFVLGKKIDSYLAKGSESLKNK